MEYSRGKYRIAQHNSPTTSDLEVNLSAGNFGFGGSQMKVPSNLMPFLYQNGGILARCGIQTSSYLRAKLVLEVNNCGSCGGRYPNEGDCVEHYGKASSERSKRVWRVVLTGTPYDPNNANNNEQFLMTRKIYESRKAGPRQTLFGTGLV